MTATLPVLRLLGPAPAVLLILLSAGAALAAETGVVRGRVVKADPAANRITVRPNAGPDMTFAVPAGSRLEAGGKPATLARFKEGQRVRVTYAEKGGTNEVILLKPAVTTDEELGREVRQALSAAKDYTFQQKEKYEAELQEVIADVDDRIDHLEAEAKDVGAEARQRLQARIADLKQKRANLYDRLGGVKSATADAWSDVRSGVNAAAADLERALNKLIKE
jgi:hypothetical protein